MNKRTDDLKTRFKMRGMTDFFYLKPMNVCAKKKK